MSFSDTLKLKVGTFCFISIICIRQTQAYMKGGYLRPLHPLPSHDFSDEIDSHTPSVVILTLPLVGKIHFLECQRDAPRRQDSHLLALHSLAISGLFRHKNSLFSHSGFPLDCFCFFALVERV